MDWSRDVYKECKEEIPQDAPIPYGKKVTLIHYFDANLMHDVLSGKSVTGCVHFANKTPIMWYSKKQATYETATYGSEFISRRICIEQIDDKYRNWLSWSKITNFQQAFLGRRSILLFFSKVIFLAH